MNSMMNMESRLSINASLDLRLVHGDHKLSPSLLYVVCDLCPMPVKRRTFGHLTQFE